MRMNARENVLSLLRREPYEWVPVEFSLCPALVEIYQKNTGEKIPYQEYFSMPWRPIEDIKPLEEKNDYTGYYRSLKPGSQIDLWGVAHEPGSEAAKHMTYMRNPLKGIDSLSEIKAYPLPDFAGGEVSHQTLQAEEIRRQGFAVMGSMQCTIWETAWYIRGMEDLMMDMMSEDPIAEYLLDAVTERAVIRASAFARAGADLLFLGDDIGMQKTPMMSTALYCQWLKPRLKQVISAAKAINPDIIVLYHSCGFAEPFIPHLIEAGVDVLNPVQPESMEFARIYNEFGGKISFHGTIGTQTVMPYGTPEDVRKTVFAHMEIAKKYGGLFPAPAHLLEPEVPWENIMAYIKACQDYSIV